MSRPQTLSHTIRTHIAEHFGGGEVFTSFDFYNICEQHGKQVKTATHILRGMHAKGLLAAMGDQPNKHGGGNTKRYAVIAGSHLTLKTVRAYQLEALQREQSMNNAAIALQSALDNMTHSRRAL